jgi:hypothetical protein
MRGVRVGGMLAMAMAMAACVPGEDVSSGFRCPDGICPASQSCVDGLCRTGGGCAATYRGIAGERGVCLDSGSSCELSFSPMTQSCADVCAGGGATCQAVYNNLGPCGHAEQLSCDTNLNLSAVCVCDQGASDGGGP